MNFRFDEQEFRDRAARALHPAPRADARFSDDDLNPDARIIPEGVVPKPAAVLVPLVPREGRLNVLLTQRTPHLKRHAGQVAFPGGRIDDSDSDAVAAALRETEEETGIAPHFVEPVGFLDTYLTGTSYRVTPVVGILRPGFDLRLQAEEVAEAFEVPLAFLMNPAHHERHSREFMGRNAFTTPCPMRAVTSGGPRQA